MTKGEKMAQEGLKRVGYPYVFGTSGATCTPAMRRKQAASHEAYAEKIRQYCPVLSGSQEDCGGCEYQGKRAYDCRGLTYRCCKIAGLSISSVGATSQWNSVDDWQERGEIKDMPRDKPCILFHRKNGSSTVMSHTGLYLGNGWVVDSRGHKDGTVQNTLESYPWTHYAIPNGADDPAAEDSQEAPEDTKQTPTLRKGSKGEAVRSLQERLIALGYSVGWEGADGKFGSATKTGVELFQLAANIKQDGIVGPQTWAAIAAAEATGKPGTPAPTYTVTITGLDAATATHLLECYPGATSQEVAAGG